MKITKIDVMLLHSSKEMKEVEPGAPADWNNIAWRPVVCRIYTDEGIYGDGEAAMAYGSAAPGAFGMVKELAGMIIGADPMKTEPIWQKIHKAMSNADNPAKNTGPPFCPQNVCL